MRRLATRVRSSVAESLRFSANVMRRTVVAAAHQKVPHAGPVGRTLRPSMSAARRAQRYDCRMEPPGITRNRRPFLAPLWLSLVAALAVGGILWVVYRSGTTTVVFLVHPAEKDPGAIADPPVSAEGEDRAQRLAHMFGETGGAGHIDALYESDDRRAQQTAAPLVQRLRRAPVVFSAAQAPTAATRAVREHAGGTVLMIVSGPAPQILHVLTVTDAAPMLVEDADVIYVISIPTFGRAHLVRLRF